MEKHIRKKLGDLLIESGLITKEQLDNSLRLQKTTGKKLGELLISEGIVTQEDIIQVLEFQLGIPHVLLQKYSIDQTACLLIPENLARRYELIAIAQHDGVLTVAMSDPLNLLAIDDIEIYTGLEVQPVIASSEDITRAIDRYFGNQHALKAVEEFKKKSESLSKIEPGKTDRMGEDLNNAPAVKLVNSLIEQAVRNRASDIHIEPSENEIKVRFRTDGQLHVGMARSRRRPGAACHVHGNDDVHAVPDMIERDRIGDTAINVHMAVDFRAEDDAWNRNRCGDRPDQRAAGDDPFLHGIEIGGDDLEWHRKIFNQLRNRVG